jgi:S-DNA-T family DNA segregation ATPase FtsK/SpoIIIE
MRDRVLREAGAVALLLGAILVAVALVSHSPLDPSPFHASTLRSSPVNWAGWLGATLSAALLAVIGVTAFLLPPVGAALGWRILRQRPLENARLTMIGWAIVVLTLPGLAALVTSDLRFRDGHIPFGGLAGIASADLLMAFAGPVGRLVILVFLLLFGGLLVSGRSAATLADAVIGAIQGRLDRTSRERLRRRREKERQHNRRKVLERQLKRMDAEDGYGGSFTVKKVAGKGRFRIVRRMVPTLGDEVVDGSAANADAAPRSTRRRKAAAARPAAGSRAAGKAVVQEEFDFVDDLEAYDLPRVQFLDEPAEDAPKNSDALIEMSKLITDKCHEFRVRGEVVNIRTGPVITTYEFRLEPGIKISAVQNLAEDLALALRTESVRIERVPGRATVGIEVPNPDPEIIRLRTLAESAEFQRAQSLLP